MFKVGDLVDVRNHGIGTVEDVVSSSIGDLKVYIVKLRETKDLLKCLDEDLSPVKEEPAEDTVTISKEDFLRAIKNIDMDKVLGSLNPFHAMILAPVLVRYSIELSEGLFGKKAEND